MASAHEISFGHQTVENKENCDPNPYITKQGQITQVHQIGWVKKDTSM